MASQLEARFWQKVEVGPEAVPGLGPCLIWIGATQRDGYGSFGVGEGRTALAHRVAYEALIGTIPVGLELDHLCRVRACIHPWHLEPVTHAENMQRAKGLNAWGEFERARTECPSGHLYAGENLKIDTRGKRVCMTCQRDYDRRRGSGGARARERQAVR